MCISTSESGYQEVASATTLRTASKQAVQRVPRKSSSRSNTPVPDSPDRSPRRVSFGSNSSRTIPRSDSFSKLEKKSMWYNEEELDKLQTKIKMVICDEVDLDENKDCWRGLEYFIHQQVQRAESELTEQEICNQIMVHLWRMENHLIDHDEEKSRDLEALAESMKQEAAESGEWLAAEDELEAFKIYMEDMDASLVRSCFQYS